MATRSRPVTALNAPILVRRTAILTGIHTQESTATHPCSQDNHTKDHILVMAGISLTKICRQRFAMMKPSQCKRVKLEVGNTINKDSSNVRHPKPNLMNASSPTAF